MDMKKLRRLLKKKRNEKSPIIVHNDFAEERKKRKCINDSPLSDFKSYEKLNRKAQKHKMLPKKINTVIFLFLQ
jgi:hypothetical protein